MRVAVMGKGRVGLALAPALKQAGHGVVYGVRDPADPKYRGDDGIPLASVREAADGAEIVVAAVMWEAVDDLLAECGDMAGKILIDCTNPYTFPALEPLIDPATSGAQIIAGKTRAAVVKTLNQVGSMVMAAAASRHPRPLQFVAADDPLAKASVMELIESIGFEPRDAGGLDYAGDLESLARLWIHQAVQQGLKPDAAWFLE